jgi:NADH:ubiquinone reductase (H+-translocating)
MFDWLLRRRPQPLPPGTSRPRVVVIGAGFGGLQVARKLARQPVDVTLLDRNNYHLFTPLLYQVASSLLNPSDIAQPVRAIVRDAPNVRFQQATVTSVDFAAKNVHTAEGRAIPYDNLVIAVGSTTNYFGIESVANSALGLKDLPEALELRNHVLGCLERASSTTDDAERTRLLTFLVVGGGPTGVESPPGGSTAIAAQRLSGKAGRIRAEDTGISRH